MYEKKGNGSRLFLTELMFSILFFILIVTVCSQLIVKAHLLSLQSSKLTQAVNVCENVAEKFLSGADAEYPLFLDENFKEGGDKYELVCIVTNEGRYEKIHIVLTEVEKDYVLYDLYTGRLARR